MKNILDVCIGIVRLLGGYILKFFFSFCPIQDKVVFSNFTGKMYGDGPRYISEELHRKHPEIKQVWVEKTTGSLKTPDYVEKVPLKSFKRRYEYATAKVWVDSHSLQLDTIKRRGQYFIELWHGSFEIKKIEGDADMPLYYMMKSRRSSNQADYFVANTKIKADLFRRAFKYKGEILEWGYPRNDILFRDPAPFRKMVGEALNIAEDDKICFYAPTFRDARDDWYDIDYERLVKALENRFGGKWVVAVRLHPVSAEREAIKIVENEFVRNATKYPDTQELLMASDICITDYSSTIYDFSLLRKPAFIYASDVAEYREERDMYWDVEKDLPFHFAKDNDDMEKNIINFEEKEYEERLNKFFEMVGPKDTGHATEDLTEKVYELIREKN